MLAAARGCVSLSFSTCALSHGMTAPSPSVQWTGPAPCIAGASVSRSASTTPASQTAMPVLCPSTSPPDVKSSALRLLLSPHLRCGTLNVVGTRMSGRVTIRASAASLPFSAQTLRGSSGASAQTSSTSAPRAAWAMALACSASTTSAASPRSGAGTYPSGAAHRATNASSSVWYSAGPQYEAVLSDAMSPPCAPQYQCASASAARSDGKLRCGSSVDRTTQLHAVLMRTGSVPTYMLSPLLQRFHGPPWSSVRVAFR